MALPQKRHVDEAAKPSGARTLTERVSERIDLSVGDKDRGSSAHQLSPGWLADGSHKGRSHRLVADMTSRGECRQTEHLALEQPEGTGKPAAQTSSRRDD